MPRRKTYREFILWEYAKLVSGQAVGNRLDYGFVTYTYKRFLSGAASPSALIRENKLLAESGNQCAYCGTSNDLQWEHIVPRALGGPDTIDNLVRACRECNSRKGAQGPFVWYGRERAGEVPRLVLGKFLKLVFQAFEERGLLDNEELADIPLSRFTLVRVFRLSLTGAASVAPVGVDSE